MTNKIRQRLNPRISFPNSWRLSCPCSQTGKRARDFWNRLEVKVKKGSLSVSGRGLWKRPLSVSGTPGFLSRCCPTWQHRHPWNLNSRTIQAQITLPQPASRCSEEMHWYPVPADRWKTDELSPGARATGTQGPVSQCLRLPRPLLLNPGAPLSPLGGTHFLGKQREKGCHPQDTFWRLPYTPISEVKVSLTPT